MKKRKSGNNGGDNGDGDRNDMLRKLDADIDQSGDSIRIGERDSLRREGVTLLLKSRGLMEVALYLAIKSEELIKMKGEVEGEGYDILEEWYKEVDDINKKLDGVMKLAREMEDMYKELRERVNKFYGMEVMRDYDRAYREMEENLGKYFSMTSSPEENGDGDDVNNKGDKDKDDYKDGGGIGIDDKGFGFDIGNKDDGEGFKEGDPDWWKK